LKILGPDNTGFSGDDLIPQPWFRKQDKRAFFNSIESMSQIYALHRQLREQPAFQSQWLESFMWPMVCNESHIAAAIELVITKESNRKIKKRLLSQEMDGMSIFSIEESESEASVLEEIFVETQDE
jgi:hypothetical protein